MKVPPFVAGALVVLSSCNAFSQDIITKKSGEDILAKIMEVSESEIKYRKFESQEGPIFVLKLSSILMIRYEDGTKDIFAAEVIEKPKQDMTLKGMQDAMANYQGRNSGAGWTSATTILFSPLIGIIPGAICASTEPSTRNLNYSDPELMKDFAYTTAYSRQAHKIKRKKVWGALGISSLFWGLLVVISNN